MRRLRPILLGILTMAAAGAASLAEAPLVILFVEGSVDQSASRAVIEEAYARLGVPVRFEVAPTGTATGAVDEGRADGELQHLSGRERLHANVVRIPVPIGHVEAAAFSRKYDFPVQGWHSLRPFRIGIVAGIVVAEQGTMGMDVRAAADNAELLDLLHSGRIDVAVMDRAAGRAAVARDPRGGVAEVEGALETLFVYHYLHAEHRELAARLHEVLEGMLRDGTTRRLRRLAHEQLLSDAP